MYLPCANDDAYPAALRQAGFQISSGYDAHLDEEEGRQRVTVSIMHVGDESGVAARSGNTTMISGDSPRGCRQSNLVQIAMARIWQMAR